MPHVLAAAIAVAVLVTGHLLAPKLGVLRLQPRSRVLSAASGISVAYVFVHLLPQIAEAQAAVDDSTHDLFSGLERHAYLIALLGLVLFYGIERSSARSRQANEVRSGSAAGAGRGVFWLSIASFATYNAVIGYLLVTRAEEGGHVDLALFTVALALHFVVNDLGLRRHHRTRYDHVGRWVLVGAVVVGWAVALTVEVAEPALGLAVAFLGGGIVLNVVKEELPDERESRFAAFGLGAGGYAVLLLLTT